MRKSIPEYCRNILVHNKNIINHRIHLRVPEQNRKVIAQYLFQLIALLMVAYRMILYLV